MADYREQSEYLERYEAGTDLRIDILAAAFQGLPLMGRTAAEIDGNARHRAVRVLADLDAARPSVVPGDTATESGGWGPGRLGKRAYQAACLDLTARIMDALGLHSDVDRDRAMKLARALVDERGPDATAGLLATARTEGEAPESLEAVRQREGDLLRSLASLATMWRSGRTYSGSARPADDLDSVRARHLGRIAREADEARLAASPQGEAQGQGEDPDRSWCFHLGKAVVDVGWEDGEPYVLAMDDRDERINADDHHPATLLDAFRVLHEFLARVTPLRADVAFPHGRASRAVAPVGNVDRETLALAFMRANVIPTVDADGSAYLDTPDHPEARRLADVALAALRGES